jgi:hypothetical protein
MRFPGRRRVALAATAAGCILAAVSGVQLAETEPARQLPRSFSTTVTSAAPSSDGTSFATSPAPDVPVPASFPPVHLSVPALRVDAPVAPTADTHTGIQSPADVSTVGWWVAGAAPEDPAGTTVLVGHVDAWDQGPGALYHLDAVRPGTLVDLTTADNRMTRYAVTALQVVRKSAGLPASLFAQDGAPRLVIITCGGPFDERTRNYLDNIVVTAVPVG